MDYDAIVVGAGPAGLTAATEIARAGKRVLVLDRESFGGRVMNTEWIEDYPRPGERVEGPKLGSELVEAAQSAGAKLEIGEVVEVESYSGCRSVTTADGKAYTAPVLVVASGLNNRKLGVPGEDRFEGKGMIHCAFCDAGFYRDKTVVVCGGGDSGVIEGLLLAKHASKVVLVESGSALSASATLQQRARAEPKLDIRLGRTIAEVSGDHAVNAVQVEEVGAGRREKLAADGVLVQVGFEPGTDYLAAVDESAVLTAGDVRDGSPRRAAAAIEDGKAAAANALKQLRQ
jgi:thioredoxin reductase (NADPH)